MRNIFLLLAFMMISCANDNQIRRFDIEGYYCGDSLIGDLALEVYDPYFVERVVVDNDSNIWFSVQEGFITEMIQFSNNPTKTESITKMISSIYGFMPIDTVSSYGSEILYWHDSASGDEIRIYGGSDSLSTLVIGNPKINAWVFEKYPLKDLEYDFTPFPDE